MTKKLTQKRLRERFYYDASTGILYYKKPRKNKSVAGYDDGRGYLLTIIDGERHYNHRLAWLYVYGYLPENFIDHINRNTLDNRISNLREVSATCNARNVVILKIEHGLKDSFALLGQENDIVDLGNGSHCVLSIFEITLNSTLGLFG